MRGKPTAMKTKKRSAWTDDEVLLEVEEWCNERGVRGNYKLGSASICGTFLARADGYYEHMGRGNVLYHKGVTPLYAVSAVRLKEFFAARNLAPLNYRNSILCVAPLRSNISTPIDNSEAIPYVAEISPLENYVSSGSVYIPGRKPEPIKPELAYGSRPRSGQVVEVVLYREDGSPYRPHSEDKQPRRKPRNRS